MPSTNRLALSATIHCLTGCGIGEVLGLVIATQLGWHDLPSILLAIVLAFVLGYSLTLRPLLASGVALGRAARLAFAANMLFDHRDGDRRQTEWSSRSRERWPLKSSTRCSGAASRCHWRSPVSRDSR
ncbi:MAG TPA: DUF4396 domain-containing protein [Candidatus Limnocylindrales bacterium]|nr:DUF4396 domain-containing protein [Candidatus Limnocylindrales bacterium]